MKTKIDPNVRRKAYGQHFLKDKNVIANISDSAKSLFEETGCTDFLEIGPGTGALTFDFISRFQAPPRLTLIERDFKLEPKWLENIKKLEAEGFKNTQFIRKDFLECEPSDWQKPNLGVLSNLPYSAGTAILVRLAEHPEIIKAMVLMFQLEVGERLCASKGSKAWGSLSVWIQNNWKVQSLLKVPPGAFKPPPKIFSLVVSLVPRDKPLIPKSQESPEMKETWNEFLKLCFENRRKMLRAKASNNARLKTALQRSGIDDTKRAEALEWSEWEALFNGYT